MTEFPTLVQVYDNSSVVDHQMMRAGAFELDSGCRKRLVYDQRMDNIIGMIHTRKCRVLMLIKPHVVYFEFDFEEARESRRAFFTSMSMSRVTQLDNDRPSSDAIFWAAVFNFPLIRIFSNLLLLGISILFLLVGNKINKWQSDNTRCLMRENTSCPGRWLGI